MSLAFTLSWSRPTCSSRSTSCGLRSSRTRRTESLQDVGCWCATQLSQILLMRRLVICLLVFKYLQIGVPSRAWDKTQVLKACNLSWLGDPKGMPWGPVIRAQDETPDVSARHKILKIILKRWDTRWDTYIYSIICFLVLWYLIFGLMVFIYSDIRFRSNDPVSHNLIKLFPEKIHCKLLWNWVGRLCSELSVLDCIHNTAVLDYLLD